MTKFGQLAGKYRVQYGSDPHPVEPLDGEMYFDNFNNYWWIYNATDEKWHYAAITTTTSTSTSTTTTSTSTTSSSTSTSTSSSTSTSTSSSTTTTL